jgi:hypothetical protein
MYGGASCGFVGDRRSGGLFRYKGDGGWICEPFSILLKMNLPFKVRYVFILELTAK